ncbi:MAG: membrane protein insertion efficiency factor YidD [bacterium]
MKTLAIILIEIYQRFLSPIIPINHCRYYPSCSEYTKEAVQLYGPLRGIGYGIMRLSRCHPLSKRNRFDPVPPLNDLKNKV